MNLDNIQITKDCIKDILGIGQTTYVNICNGTQHLVPWGAGDWVIGIVAGISCLFFIGFVFYIIKEVIK
jgi:hypothetical protein